MQLPLRLRPGKVYYFPDSFDRECVIDNLTG